MTVLLGVQKQKNIRVEKHRLGVHKTREDRKGHRLSLSVVERGSAIPFGWNRICLYQGTG
jgi:hypothetical protein